MFYTPPPQPHDHPPHPAVDLARRLDAVFLPLLQHITAAFFALGLFANPAWTRISRARVRLTGILTRLAEGAYPRPRAPRPAPPPGTPARKGGPPAPYLPRRRGWLGHVAGYHVRGVALQLTHTLNDPGTLAILATAPPHARAAFTRALRGPARLLALDLPPALRPPPRPAPAPRPSRARSRPAPPPRPPSPPDRPIPGNILAAARYYKRRFGKGR